ncbi:MAG: hypothetical protein RR199_05190 [Alistipes sp.]
MGIFEPKFKKIFSVLIQIISHYLTSHKRLVVPQLGAFIVKEPEGRVLFSEMLKRDDGVLRELLCKEGASEVEAAGLIDRFVFEVRYAVEHGAVYRIEGLGILRQGENQTLAFDYLPHVTAEPIAEPEPELEPIAEPEPELELVTEPIAEPELELVAEPIAEPMSVPVQPTVKPATLPLPTVTPLSTEKTDKTEKNKERAQPSSRLTPEPCLRGLRYGKPHKSTDVFTLVDRPPHRRRVDRFLLFAILAVVIAIAAIAFGYYQQTQNKELTEPAAVEQPENASDSPKNDISDGATSETINK